ncbi:MAG: hypothetical protein Q8K65_09365 [Alphaproteobacteria bacterium]|nr:hypothetical protein [Alphaproteobacteria bacterium]
MSKEPLFPTAADNPADTAPLADTLPQADAPVHAARLDADLYLAEDLDGVTESLFGSGNLNYLLLQARQTDAAAAGAGFDSVNALHAEPASALAALSAAQQAAIDAQALENALSVNVDGEANTAGTGGSANLSSGAGAAGDYSHAAAGTGFSAVAHGDQSPAAVSDGRLNADDGTDDDDDDDGNNNDNDNDDDGDGDNGGGNNGGGGGGDDSSGNNGDIDVLVDNNIGLPVIDINLDPLENIVGDIDLGIGIGFDPDDGLTIDLDTVLLDIPLVGGEINIDIPLLNPVIGAVLDIADPVLDSVTGIVQPVLDGVSVTVESLIGSLLGAPPPIGDDYDLSIHTDLGIPNIDVNLDVIEDIIGDIDISVTFGHDENGIDIGIETIVADLPLVNSDIHLDVPVLTPVVNGALDPVAEMLDTLTDPETLAGLADDPLGSLPDIVETVVGGTVEIVESTISGLAESLEDTLGNFGQSDDSPDDYDLAVGNNLGLPQLDINLDQVEAITGDIDLGVSLNHGDDGLTIGLDTVLAGIDILDDVSVTVDIPLVNPLIGDVIDIAQGLLGEAASDEGTASGAMALIDGVTQGIEDTLSGILGSGDGDAHWPELGSGLLDGTLDAVGNLLGDTDGALHLPEPIGNIVEGLGLLPSGSEHGGGLLSGLFSGHGGGLFG